MVPVWRLLFLLSSYSIRHSLVRIPLSFWESRQQYGNGGSHNLEWFYRSTTITTKPYLLVTY